MNHVNSVLLGTITSPIWFQFLISHPNQTIILLQSQHMMTTLSFISEDWSWTKSHLSVPQAALLQTSSCWFLKLHRTSMRLVLSTRSGNMATATVELFPTYDSTDSTRTTRPCAHAGAFPRFFRIAQREMHAALSYLLAPFRCWLSAIQSRN